MLKPAELPGYTKKYRKENYRFRSWLKIHADPKDLDRRFRRLHQELFADYDCSSCRNCCKQYRGSIPREDLARDAKALGMTVEAFKARFLQENEDPWAEDYLTRSRPCDFLQADGSCLLGDHKPESCRTYPHTDQPDRMGSLLSFLDIISICPVACEIWDRLKEEYDFDGFMVYGSIWE